MGHRLKGIGVAALVAAFATLVGAGSASATTLEVNGVTQNRALTLTASLEAATSLTLSRTDGTSANTCTESHLHGAMQSPFTGAKLTGALSILGFTGCDFTVTVDKPGQLYFEHIAGTTNGTVFSENAEVTVETPFGFHVNCKTGAGTDMGRTIGASSGMATIDINAVLNCGFLLPSATWKGSYWLTSGGFGVSA